MKNSIEQNDQLCSSILQALSLFDDSHILELYTSILKDNPNLYSIHKTYPNKNFLEIINLEIDKKVKNTYNLSGEERWLLVKSKEDNPKFKEMFFYDKGLKLISKK